jgi:hypothetical protein
MTKIRQRISSINSFRVSSLPCPQLRRALFSSYVLPPFAWIYPLYPFFTDNRRSDLSHFYYTCSVYTGMKTFSHTHLNKSLWKVGVLSIVVDSIDGELLSEKNIIWINLESLGPVESSLWSVWEDLRDLLLSCISSAITSISISYYAMKEVLVLQDFPETFYDVLLWMLCLFNSST